MASEKTIDFNGKSYILTSSGWIEAKSRLRVDASTARKLDKLATVKLDQVDRLDANVLLEQAINARADKQLLRAEQLVRQVLRSTPDNLIAYAVLSGILRDRGRPEQALNETAHVQHLEYAPLLTSRAAAYCDLDRWEDAVQELKPVLAAGGSKEAFQVVHRIKSACPDLYPPKRQGLPSLPAEQRSPQIVQQRQEPGLKHVIVYTDGACIGNPGPGGYGVVLTLGSHRKELSGGFRHTTNNRMEMMAAIVALESLKYRCRVTIYSDSQYLVASMSQGWAQSWRSNGWMRNKKERAANADLWSRLLDLAAQHEVEFVWIKGHAGHLENERCDMLSTQATQAENLPIDTEYENDQALATAAPILFDLNSNPSSETDQTSSHRGWSELGQWEYELRDILLGTSGRDSGNKLRIHVARSRHIILLERSASASLLEFAPTSAS